MGPKAFCPGILSSSAMPSSSDYDCKACLGHGEAIAEGTSTGMKSARQLPYRADHQEAAWLLTSEEHTRPKDKAHQGSTCTRLAEVFSIGRAYLRMARAFLMGSPAVKRASAWGANCTQAPFSNRLSASHINMHGRARCDASAYH